MLQRSHLFHLHTALGASFQEVLGWEMPWEYRGVEHEYKAAREATALMDRSHVGRLRVTGRDALDLLNRLSTNKLESLPSGTGAATVLTTNKGRIVDLLVVAALEDHLLLLTSPQNRSKVVSWLDTYTFMEDIRVEDITTETTMLGVMGPRTWDVIRDVVGKDLSPLPLYGSVLMDFRGLPLSLIHTDPAGILGVDLLVGGEEAGALWQDLLKAGASHGLIPMGEEAFEAIRLQEGVPRYGRELSEEVNPLEACLRPFISFSKGCYIGQEVVARLDTYKKVQRRLMALRFPSAEAPRESARLTIDGRDVGFVTSSARIPGRDESVAMGYIRMAHAKADVHVRAEGDGVVLEGEALEPPFLSRCLAEQVTP